FGEGPPVRRRLSRIGRACGGRIPLPVWARPVRRWSCSKECAAPSCFLAGLYIVCRPLPTGIRCFWRRTSVTRPTLVRLAQPEKIVVLTPTRRPHFGGGVWHRSASE